MNQLGIAHGGVTMTLIDVALGTAALWLPQIPSAWRERPNRAMNARCGTCST
jgi:hypothetical protein